MNNIIATVVTFAISLIFLRSMDFIAQRGYIDSKLSRKIIHIGTGPIFVLCWFLFQDTPSARWWAALVPLIITVQFALIGLGILKDEASVQAMSRTGDPKEILRGPLYYGIMFVALTVIFWKDSPIGIIALMIMCGGDGIADIVGRSVKSPKLFWSKEKSIAGSSAVFLGGFVLSVAIILIYISAGALAGSIANYVLPITLIALIGMLVESLPYKDIDNVTVTLAAVIVGLFFF